MDKRKFIKTSSLLASGVMLSGLPGCRTSKVDQEALTNWAGNQTYSTSNLHSPKSIDELAHMVRRAGKMRGLGTRHSFNTIADSKHMQISMEGLNDVASVDRSSNTIVVGAGARYGQFCDYIDRQGYGLHNLASLPHISVAGACATSTHGSGVTNGGLATGVHSFEMVLADGSLVTLTSGTEEFNGAIIGLGSMGLVVKMNLNLLPTYDMQQRIYRNMAMEVFRENFVEIMSSGYSVSLFTDWKDQNINQVWIKDKHDAPDKIQGDEYFGAKVAKVNLHPVESISAESCTEQLGIEGRWYERLPHFKMEFTPSAGDELQAEYFVPIEHGYEAMVAIENLHEHISPHLFISEIRTIAADDFWMSPFYNQPSVAIHFTFKPNWPAVQKLMPLIEEALDPYNVRPHWGKLFAMAPAKLQSRIEKIKDFKQLMKEYDPKGKFRNAFIEKNLYS